MIVYDNSNPAADSEQNQRNHHLIIKLSKVPIVSTTMIMGIDSMTYNFI